MENITLEQIKKNLAEEYAKYCSDYWYAVYLKRNIEKEGVDQTVIDYHAERVMKEAEKRRAFRRALKVSGLFTKEERLEISREENKKWAKEFDNVFHE